MSFHATIPIFSKEVDNNKHLNNKKYTTALATKSENVFLSNEPNNNHNQIKNPCACSFETTINKQ